MGWGGPPGRSGFSGYGAGRPGLAGTTMPGSRGGSVGCCMRVSRRCIDKCTPREMLLARLFPFFDVQRCVVLGFQDSASIVLSWVAIEPGGLLILGLPGFGVLPPIGFFNAFL